MTYGELRRKLENLAASFNGKAETPTKFGRTRQTGV